MKQQNKTTAPKNSNDAQKSTTTKQQQNKQEEEEEQQNSNDAKKCLKKKNGNLLQATGKERERAFLKNNQPGQLKKEACLKEHQRKNWRRGTSSEKEQGTGKDKEDGRDRIGKQSMSQESKGKW